jgi:hypothetical protein
MANTDESPEDRSGDQTSGLILNKRYAITAAILTFVILASALRSSLMQASRHRWLLEPPWQSHQLTPLAVGFSFFFWGFTLWILFCFYRGARNRYERFLVGGSAVGFLLGIVEGFLPSAARIELEPASIAGFLVSFAAAMTLLFKLPSKTRASQPN